MLRTHVGEAARVKKGVDRGAENDHGDDADDEHIDDLYYAPTPS